MRGTLEEDDMWIDERDKTDETIGAARNKRAAPFI
jgi:hypothetical protein